MIGIEKAAASTTCIRNWMVPWKDRSEQRQPIECQRPGQGNYNRWAVLAEQIEIAPSMMYDLATNSSSPEIVFEANKEKQRK